MLQQVAQPTFRLSQPTTPRLLFVHGIYHASEVWDETVLTFRADGLLCNTLNLPGRADNLLGPGSVIDQMVERLRNACAMHDTPPIVVAHSAGGNILDQLIARGDAPISGAVFVATPAYGLSRTMATQIAMVKHFGLDPSKAPAFARLLNHLYYNDMLSGYGSESLARAHFIMESPRVLLAFYRLWMRRQQPRNFSGPALIIHGSQDRMVPVSAAYALAALYTRTTPDFTTTPTVVEVRRAPHNLMLTHAAQFTIAISRWLQQHFQPITVQPIPQPALVRSVSSYEDALPLAAS